ncbi:putative membrane protein [Moraxella catarrhalis]|uniref:Membrane protein n=1 Tax=Moraxella catarrhalis TaxID=480 RepID=A0A3Q9GHT5_MORCA|nr:putative membrane protein [Moraxella catarrhalis]AZQ96090.1 putative membrane protein [Moraxella catarrhalis]RUO13559.1 putative membrane protein [Moraxella catarrhalis]RUO14774.1 putative membrane protein [Moraxella catarrhalis]RUO15324.1 putative membrane protein [Moraxella catarrhalis]
MSQKGGLHYKMALAILLGEFCISVLIAHIMMLLPSHAF